VLANTTVEVPEVMYEIRMGDMMEDFESRLRQSGLDLESYLMYTGSDKEKYKEGFRPQAERQVKIRLALEKIAKLEGMDVTDEEYDDEYKKLAEKYGMKEEEVRAAIPAKDLKQDLLVEKAIKFVRDHAKITEAAEGEEAAPAPKKRAAKKKPAKEAETAAVPAEETPAEPAAEKPAEEAAAEEAPAPKKRTVRKKKSDIDMDID